MGNAKPSPTTKEGYSAPDARVAFERHVVDSLARIEIMLHRLTDDQANALVTLDWIRERLAWGGVSDRAAYQRLRLKGVHPKTGTAYRRGDVETAYKLGANQGEWG